MAARARATPKSEVLPVLAPEHAERQAGVHEAKTHLSRLLDEVEAGAPW